MGGGLAFLGGLAGGAAQGAQTMQQLQLQNMYYGGRVDNGEEANRIREEAIAARTGKGGGGGGSGSGGGGSKGADYEGFDNSLIPIFQAGETNKPVVQPAPAMANQAGLAGPGPSSATLPNVGTLANNPAAAYQGAGLGASALAQAAPAEPQTPMNPRQEIVKQMMFGNLANEPDKLNAIAAAAAVHGLGDKITPWLEVIYKAKKSGILDGAMNLINNNVDGAINSLKQGGINLADRPTKVEPDNPNDYRWKINIDGTGERVMDVRNMVASTMDPEKFMDMQNKTKVANAQAEAHTANAEESRAKAKVYGSGGGLGRSPGGKGGGNTAPKVQKTVETAQGIVAVMSDGSHRALKGADGKPLFGTTGLKVAAGLVGKTLDPLGDNSGIAGKVTDLAGQLEGGLDTPPPPKSTTRVFNPKTGKFD